MITAVGSTLQNLQTLTIRNEADRLSMDMDGVSGLKALTELQILNKTGRLEGGAVPRPVLLQLTSLRKLTLEACVEVNDVQAAAGSFPSSITSLELRRIEWERISYYYCLPKLQQLILQPSNGLLNAQWCLNILREVSALEQLQEFVLVAEDDEDDEVHLSLPEEVTQLQQLRVLRLQGSDPKQTGLPVIMGIEDMPGWLSSCCPQLRELGTIEIGNKPPAGTCYSHLTRLRVQWHCLEGECPVFSVAALCPQLELLEVAAGQNTAGHLVQCLQLAPLPQLQQLHLKLGTLEITNCTMALGPEVLRDIAGHLSGLRVLQLTLCPIDEPALVEFLSGLPSLQQLEELWLGCHFLEAPPVPGRELEVPVLSAEELRVRKEMADAVFQQVEQLQGLRRLRLYGLKCNQSVEALGEMVGKLSQLQELGFEKCGVDRYDLCGSAAEMGEFKKKLPCKCQLVFQEWEQPLDSRWGF